MKVKELIKELQQFDENQIVHIEQHSERGYNFSIRVYGIVEREVKDVNTSEVSNIVVIKNNNNGK